MPNTDRKLFFGLFIFPLLIAVGMAVLLCSVVLLTNETETPETLISAIKTGSVSKRWQKAFELSNELNRGSHSIRSEAVMREIIYILGDRELYDSKTRGYMAIALSHFHKPEAASALQKNLGDSDKDVLIYTLWALGAIGAKESESSIAPFLKNESDELRKMSAYVLGIIGNQKTTELLLPLLKDSVSDVRWNAALALARLGNNEGQEVLLKMLDRDTLVSQFQMDETQIESLMINSTKGLALIGNKKAQQILEFVSHNEKNLKVRQAAMDAIQYQNAHD